MELCQLFLPSSYGFPERRGRCVYVCVCVGGGGAHRVSAEPKELTSSQSVTNVFGGSDLPTALDIVDGLCPVLTSLPHPSRDRSCLQKTKTKPTTQSCLGHHSISRYTITPLSWRGSLDTPSQPSGEAERADEACADNADDRKALEIAYQKDWSNWRRSTVSAVEDCTDIRKGINITV